MNALLRLNLSHNSLSDRLTHDSFSGLLTLQSLDLSANELTKTPWEALNTLNSLQYLYLQVCFINYFLFSDFYTIFLISIVKTVSDQPVYSRKQFKHQSNVKLNIKTFEYEFESFDSIIELK